MHTYKPKHFDILSVIFTSRVFSSSWINALNQKLTHSHTQYKLPKSRYRIIKKQIPWNFVTSQQKTKITQHEGYQNYYHSYLHYQKKDHLPILKQNKTNASIHAVSHETPISFTKIPYLLWKRNSVIHIEHNNRLVHVTLMMISARVSSLLEFPWSLDLGG